MLMVQRAQQPSKGKLDFPGGFVDYNGSNEQALITELLEELQLPIDNMEYLFSYPNRYLWLDVSSVNSNELAFFHQGKIPWGCIYGV
jgi:NAD+ diphosphatase